MKDIKIINNAIDLQSNDFQLVDKADKVIQGVYIALRTLKRDWFLDSRVGLDYFTNLKLNNDALLKNEIFEAVKNTNGVDEITSFYFKRTAENTFIVKIVILIDEQEYTITEGLVE